MPKGTKIAVCGVKLRRIGRAFAAKYGADPYRHQPWRSAGTRSLTHGTASFAKSTSMAGHASVSVISQLTLQVDY
jgi:hypothetical protein